VTSATQLRQHQWVQLTFTPVDVLDNGHGRPTVFTDPDKLKAALEIDPVVCFACHINLDEGWGQGCPGEG
jgi:hypothetical protein